MWPCKILCCIHTLPNKCSFPTRHSTLCFTLALNGEIILWGCNVPMHFCGSLNGFMPVLRQQEPLHTGHVWDFLISGVVARRECWPELNHLQKQEEMNECRHLGESGQKGQGRNTSDLLMITQEGHFRACWGLCRLPRHLKSPKAAVKPSSP